MQRFDTGPLSIHNHTEGHAVLLHLLVLVCLLLVFPFPVLSQLNPIENFAVCIAKKAQHFPVVTKVKDDGAIVAWRDARNENYDVYAQMIDKEGNLLWQPDGIPVCDHESSQGPPILVSDMEDGAIIIWGDTRNGSQDCYAQRIDSTGQKMWEPDGVAVCIEKTLQDDFVAVSDGSGGVIVIWEDWRTGNQDIFAQRISADGIPIWKQNGIPVYAGQGDQYDPVLIPDNDGGAIVAWWDFNTPDWNVYAQKIDRNGNTEWEKPTPVCTAKGNQGSPQLISDGKGGAYCVWSDFRNDPNLFTRSQLYTQHLTEEGKTSWEKDGIPICKMSVNQQQADSVSDGKGGFIVVWWDDRDIFADIYAQRINSDGILSWDPNGIAVCTAGGVQQIPKLVSDGTNGCIVYWLDYRNDFGDITEDAIYAQRLDFTGNILWNKDGIPVCNAEKEQITPTAISTEAGSAIVIWSDARGTDYDIYMQRIPE